MGDNKVPIKFLGDSRTVREVGDQATVAGKVLPQPGFVLAWCPTIGFASPGVDSTIISILGMKKGGELGYSIQNGFRGRSCGWGRGQQHGLRSWQDGRCV